MTAKSATSFSAANRLTLNFVTSTGSILSSTAVGSGAIQDDTLPLDQMSAGEQEQLLLEEVLAVLIGVDSSIITVHHVPPNRVGFMVCLLF